MGEVSVMDNPFDSMLEAVKAGNTQDLMRLSGQADEDQPKAGLSRLNINYDQENEEGVQLKRGTWRMYLD